MKSVRLLPRFELGSVESNFWFDKPLRHKHFLRNLNIWIILIFNIFLFLFCYFFCETIQLACFPNIIICLFIYLPLWWCLQDSFFYHDDNMTLFMILSKRQHQQVKSTSYKYTSKDGRRMCRLLKQNRPITKEIYFISVRRLSTEATVTPEAVCSSEQAKYVSRNIFAFLTQLITT